MHRIAVGRSGDRATLYVGRDQWPFPARWSRRRPAGSFDAAAAREEVLLRRIGQNELDVIDLMHGYVRAQARLPRRATRTATGCRASPPAILSSAGKRDGLYWPTEPGEPESPIGDFMARAAADGYSVDGDRRRARALSRLLLPRAAEAGRRTPRAARSTTW